MMLLSFFITKSMGMAGSRVISASLGFIAKSSPLSTTIENIFTMASFPLAVMKSSSFAASDEIRFMSSPAVRLETALMESCCDFSNTISRSFLPMFSETRKVCFMLKYSNTPSSSIRIIMVPAIIAMPGMLSCFGVT